MPVGIRHGSKPRLDANNPFLTYLDHDHRERENVRFFAICLLVQDLWRCPSHAMTMIIRITSHGVEVLGDPSETKIRDPRMVGGIHEDVWLDISQYSGERGLE